MTTRLKVLDHVLEVLQFPQAVITAIKDDGSVGSVGLLSNIDTDSFLQLEGVKIGHSKSLELFKFWVQDYVQVNDEFPLDWEIEFTEEVWEEYILKQSLLSLTAKPDVIKSEPNPSSLSFDRPRISFSNNSTSHK